MTPKKAEKTILEAGLSVEKFYDWMNGQTMGLYPNGTTNIYDQDVERFIRYAKRGRPENSAEFD